ncbi:MAG: coniferyl aldehyde dehydrogenase [Candidatus Lambdaproteobacteria bacterium]|nr:coniferyl aldehyde dehydrogenase [Candidatus Lambdaproteobacteria bacterium]
MTLDALFAGQRRAAQEQPTPTAAQRRDALTRLLRLVHDRRQPLADAVNQDFGHRSRHEFLITEVYTTLKAIRHSRRHVGRWMRARRVPVSLELLPARARVMVQPRGVVGIISPWNYPLYLSFVPLAAALAAGNRVLLKPSEHTPRTAALMAELLAGAFKEAQVAVVTGAADVGRAFTALPFDHLLYTGSTEVGREVMRAAAGQLTPVTLELGGKSPAIVGCSANLRNAARSIMTGKLINAGQTCIAPDYVLLPEPACEAFVRHAREAVAALYPDLHNNADYTAIVNGSYYARLQAHLADARAKGARAVALAAEAPEGGAARRLTPHLLLEVSDSMSVMQEEIFGPLLPLVPYREIDEAIAYVNARPRPLALYYFGRDRAEQRRVLGRTVSGGVTVNDTLFHIAVDDLPFGGVGASGMGAYHGRAGFDTFSVLKPVFYQSPVNGGVLLRPPFGWFTEALVRLLIGRR